MVCDGWWWVGQGDQDEEEEEPSAEERLMAVSKQPASPLLLEPCLQLAPSSLSLVLSFLL